MEELQQCYKENILMVINEIEVEDFSVSGDELEYILILDNSTNETILKTICAITQSSFNIKENTDGDYIDIMELGFEFGEWWSSSEGFQYKAK